MTGKKYLNIVVHNLIMLSVVCSCSTKIERPDSYNYNRGCEALQNEEREEAMKYFEKEVENNPENGYAWGYIMQLHSRDAEYGKAISAGEKALKYINKKDTEWRAYVHAGIGAAYLNIDQTDKAIAEISEAIKDEPEDIDYLERRAI